MVLWPACPVRCVVQDLRTIVLLNCGASTYVKDFAPASCYGTRFIVVDSHRPVHPRYNNSDDTDALLVLAEDDPLPRQEVPPANDALDALSAQGEGGWAVAAGLRLGSHTAWPPSQLRHCCCKLRSDVTQRACYHVCTAVASTGQQI